MEKDWKFVGSPSRVLTSSEIDAKKRHMRKGSSQQTTAFKSRKVAMKLDIEPVCWRDNS